MQADAPSSSPTCLAAELWAAEGREAWAGWILAGPLVSDLGGLWGVGGNRCASWGWVGDDAMWSEMACWRVGSWGVGGGSQDLQFQEWGGHLEVSGFWGEGAVGMCGVEVWYWVCG